MSETPPTVWHCEACSKAAVVPREVPRMCVLRLCPLAAFGRHRPNVELPRSRHSRADTRRVLRWLHRSGTRRTALDALAELKDALMRQDKRVSTLSTSLVALEEAVRSHFAAVAEWNAAVADRVPESRRQDIWEGMLDAAKALRSLVPEAPANG